MLIEHMGDGLSFEAFAGVIGKSKETLYQWVKAHPNFADAKKKGDALSLLFWEKMGLTGMAGKIRGFNVAAWIFNMKNRHGYRDKSPDEKPPERDPALEDAIAELERERASNVSQKTEAQGETHERRTTAAKPASDTDQAKRQNLSEQGEDSGGDLEPTDADS